MVVAVQRVETLTLRTEGDTEFVHLVFTDGSSVDLKGPRSRMTYTEHTEDGVTTYDCQFEGFELA